MATRVLDVDLATGLRDQDGLVGYRRAYVLVRHHGKPMGTVLVTCRDGRLRAEDLFEAIERDVELCERIADDVLERRLAPSRPRLHGPSRSWSVVIPTKDRADQLRECLGSVIAAAPPGGEIIVVDNAPSDDTTERLVAGYPVRYEREDRRGAAWARARGARAAGGEIVVFTDDDTVVEPGWIEALLEPFDHPRVAAVTGPGLPLELETDAQELFEFVCGGFARGFRRREFDLTNIAAARAVETGASANLAMRRTLVNGLRLFDVELGPGSAGGSGEDTYAIYRLLAAGYRVIYTPDALIWHRHRRDYASMRKMLNGYGKGQYAFWTRCVVDQRDLQAARAVAGWTLRHYPRELVRSLRRRGDHLPVEMLLDEIRGALGGPRAYRAGRRLERARVADPNRRSAIKDGDGVDADASA